MKDYDKLIGRYVSYNTTYGTVEDIIEGHKQVFAVMFNYHENNLVITPVDTIYSVEDDNKIFVDREDFLAGKKSYRIDFETDSDTEYIRIVEAYNEAEVEEYIESVYYDFDEPIRKYSFYVIDESDEEEEE